MSFKLIYRNTGIIKLKFLKKEIMINYGKVEINNSQKMNIVYLKQYEEVPFLFISPISKGNLITPHINTSNAIYPQNVTNKGFSIVSQKRDTRMNDIAKYVYWIAIGR